MYVCSTLENAFKANMHAQNPSYEDMLLLSSLLGPVKPPVASREDVDLAPGLYKVFRGSSGLVATAIDSGDELSIATGERCLVCLSAYEPNEELRQLSKCSHLFHKECIDEVSFEHRPSIMMLTTCSG